MFKALRLAGLFGILCIAACVTVVGQATAKKPAGQTAGKKTASQAAGKQKTATQKTLSEAETARLTDAYISEAQVYYLRHDYKDAIPLFRKALDLQKKTPTLDRARWRELVTALGEAYGISGDEKRSQETFAYGLSKDPKYWVFHYDMACHYAEVNDVDKAIYHLRLAFEKRDKAVKYADPWTDRSFQGLMGNDKFVQALREIDIH